MIRKSDKRRIRDYRRRRRTSPCRNARQRVHQLPRLPKWTCAIPKGHPHADTDAIQAVAETLWETCPTCIAEYQEYTDAIPCEHGIRGGFETVMPAWTHGQTRTPPKMKSLTSPVIGRHFHSNPPRCSFYRLHRIPSKQETR